MCLGGIVTVFYQTAELAVFSAIAKQKCFETLRTVLFGLEFVGSTLVVTPA
jgi:hypothetical protein